jgi:hypothetical protein
MEDFVSTASPSMLESLTSKEHCLVLSPFIVWFCTVMGLAIIVQSCRSIASTRNQATR